MAVDIKKLRARFRALREERNPYESVYRDLVDYILPNSGRFEVSDRPADEERWSCIYDATATDAVDALAAGMLSGMTSPARPWFRLTTGVRELDERDDVKRWLAQTTQDMQGVFAQSNVYDALIRCYQELAVFGTACMVALPSDEDVVHIHTMTVGEYWIAEDAEQKVHTLFRRFTMTAEQLIQEFGESAVSDAVKQAYREDRDRYRRFTVIHAIEPREDYIEGSLFNDEKPFRSVYFEEQAQDGKDKPLIEEGFAVFPGLCPRWSIQGSDVYGTSPGMKALRQVMGLQVEAKRKGQGIDLQTNPPMMLPASMENHQIDFAPGGVSFYGDDSTPKQAVPARQASVNLSDLVGDIQDTRQQINGFFYKDLFTAIMSTPRTNRTATEVDQIAQERMALLGPVLQRLNRELLRPLIASTYYCMQEAGLVKEPPEDLPGVTVSFESILVQALRASGITAEDRFMQYVLSLATSQPDVLDNVDFDEAIQGRAADQGVNPRIVRDRDAVARIREARQQAQQQQVQMQQAAQLAQITQGLQASNPAMAQTPGIQDRQGY